MRSHTLASGRSLCQLLETVKIQVMRVGLCCARAAQGKSALMLMDSCMGWGTKKPSAEVTSLSPSSTPAPPMPCVTGAYLDKDEF